MSLLTQLLREAGVKNAPAAIRDLLYSFASTSHSVRDKILVDAERALVASPKMSLSEMKKLAVWRQIHTEVTAMRKDSPQLLDDIAQTAGAVNVAYQPPIPGMGVASERALRGLAPSLGEAPPRSGGVDAIDRLHLELNSRLNSKLRGQGMVPRERPLPVVEEPGIPARLQRFPATPLRPDPPDIFPGGQWTAPKPSGLGLWAKTNHLYDAAMAERTRLEEAAAATAQHVELMSRRFALHTTGRRGHREILGVTDFPPEPVNPQAKHAGGAFRSEVEKLTQLVLINRDRTKEEAAKQLPEGFAEAFPGMIGGGGGPVQAALDDNVQHVAKLLDMPLPDEEGALLNAALDAAAAVGLIPVGKEAAARASLRNSYKFVRQSYTVSKQLERTSRSLNVLEGRLSGLRTRYANAERRGDRREMGRIEDQIPVVEALIAETEKAMPVAEGAPARMAWVITLIDRLAKDAPRSIREKVKATTTMWKTLEKGGAPPGSIPDPEARMALRSITDAYPSTFVDEAVAKKHMAAVAHAVGVPSEVIPDAERRLRMLSGEGVITLTGISEVESKKRLLERGVPGMGIGAHVRVIEGRTSTMAGSKTAEIGSKSNIAEPLRNAPDLFVYRIVESSAPTGKAPVADELVPELLAKSKKLYAEAEAVLAARPGMKRYDSERAYARAQILKKQALALERKARGPSAASRAQKPLPATRHLVALVGRRSQPHRLGAVALQDLELLAEPTDETRKVAEAAYGAWRTSGNTGDVLLQDYRALGGKFPYALADEMATVFSVRVQDDPFQTVYTLWPHILVEETLKPGRVPRYHQASNIGTAIVNAREYTLNAMKEAVAKAIGWQASASEGVRAQVLLAQLRNALPSRKRDRGYVTLISALENSNRVTAGKAVEGLAVKQFTAKGKAATSGSTVGEVSTTFEESAGIADDVEGRELLDELLGFVEKATAVDKEGKRTELGQFFLNRAFDMAKRGEFGGDVGRAFDHLLVQELVNSASVNRLANSILQDKHNAAVYLSEELAFVASSLQRETIADATRWISMDRLYKMSPMQRHALDPDEMLPMLAKEVDEIIYNYDLNPETVGFDLVDFGVAETMLGKMGKTVHSSETLTRLQDVANAARSPVFRITAKNREGQARTLLLDPSANGDVTFTQSEEGIKKLREMGIALQERYPNGVPQGPCGIDGV